MTDHLVSINDLFEFPSEVIARLSTQLKDPATVLGALRRAQALAETGRLVPIGTYIRDGIFNRQGVLGNVPAGGYAVAGQNMQRDIDAVTGVHGQYLLQVPTVTRIIVPAVTSARWDLVVLRSRDTGSGNDALTYDTVELVTGTTTAQPATPARSLPLWVIKHPANNTNLSSATWEDVRKFTAPVGSPIFVKTAADATGLPTGTQVYDAEKQRMKVMHSFAGVPTLLDLLARDVAYFTTSPTVPSGSSFISGWTRIGAPETVRPSASVDAGNNQVINIDGTSVYMVNATMWSNTGHALQSWWRINRFHDGFGLGGVPVEVNGINFYSMAAIVHGDMVSGKIRLETWNAGTGRQMDIGLYVAKIQQDS